MLPSPNSLTDFTKIQETWQPPTISALPIITVNPWLHIAFTNRSMIIWFYYSLDVWSKNFTLLYFLTLGVLPLPFAPIKRAERHRQYIYSVFVYNRSSIHIQSLCVGVCTRRMNKCACQTHPRSPAPSALHDMKHLWFLTHAAPCNLLNLCSNGSLSPDIVHLSARFCSKL